MIEQAAALALAATLAVLGQLVYAVATRADLVVSLAVFVLGAILGGSMIVLADRMTCARRQQGSKRGRSPR